MLGDVLNSLFWGAKFHHLATKRIPVQLMYQGFFVQNNALKDIRLQKYSKILKFFYFLHCTQICLIPLVVDCQCGYSTE